MKSIKISVSVLLLCVIAVLSGCGSGGTPTITSSSSNTLVASVSGSVYAPSGVATSRVAGRIAQASATGKDNKVPSATVTVKRMKSDGTLESLGDNYTATTDANGNFTIENVPQEENIIVEASANVTVGTNTKTLKLRKAFSLTDTEVSAGSMTGIDLDVATTLAVEVMKDIITTANASLTDSEKISGSELPRETLTDLENEIETALTADQALSTPTVNLLTCVTEGDTEVDTQLTTLENSGNGATLKSKKDKAASKGSLRVHVVVLGGESPLEGGTVVLTVDGAVQTGTTDSKGNAFFDEFTVGASIEIEVNKDGYKMVKTSKNIEKAAVVNNVTVQMEAISTNQAPVAKAGADQTANVSDTVSLDGSNSFDPDGDTLTYAWTQTAGTTVTLSSTTAATATFTPSANETYTFSLTVSDGSLASESDTVDIVVGSTSTGDTTAPTVSSFSPVDGATGVAYDQPTFKVAFSEAMDTTVNLNTQATLTASGFNITLQRADTGGSVTINSTNALAYGTFAWTTTTTANDTLAFTLNSSSSLSSAGLKTLYHNVTYNIIARTVPTNLTDVAGNSLDSTTNIPSTGSFATRLSKLVGLSTTDNNNLILINTDGSNPTTIPKPSGIYGTYDYAADADGTIYLTLSLDGTNDALYKYSGGQWSSISTSVEGFIDVDGDYLVGLSTTDNNNLILINTDGSNPVTIPKPSGIYGIYDYAVDADGTVYLTLTLDDTNTNKALYRYSGGQWSSISTSVEGFIDVDGDYLVGLSTTDNNNLILINTDGSNPVTIPKPSGIYGIYDYAVDADGTVYLTLTLDDTNTNKALYRYSGGQWSSISTSVEGFIDVD